MNKIQVYFLFKALVFIVLCQNCAWSQQHAEALLAQHQARFEAMIRADTAVLAPFLHPALRYVHSNGMVENYSAHLGAIVSKKIVYQKFEEKTTPAVYTWKKGALIQGRVGVSGLVQGNPFDIVLWYTAVYQKEKGRWRLLSWQSTRE